MSPQGIELDTPDLNVPSFERLDFDAMVALGVARARARPPRAIVGSSLGALVALMVARDPSAALRAAPLVLIAPALGIADRWITCLPPGDPISVFNQALGANAPIHRAFFERMARVDADRHPPARPVTVIMGRNDESVGFENVERVWREWEPELAEGSKFVEIPDGDHGLVDHVEIIAAEIAGSCGLRVASCERPPRNS